MSAEPIVHRFAVAGIPFQHDAEPGVPVPSWITPKWEGSRVTDEPLRVHHAIGDTDAHDLQPLTEEMPAYGEYYVDRHQNLAIRSRGMGLSGDLRQLLRTKRNGFDYALRYERPEDALRLQWGWHRTIFMFALPARERGLIVHATGFLLPGRLGVLCPGVSGAGKSTLARTLLTEPFGRATVLGDDRIAVTAEPGGLHLWGTPWHSSAETALADDASCSALVFMRHGEGARLSKLPPRAASRLLLRTVAVPYWDSRATAFALAMVERMVRELPCFEFTYEPAPGSAATLVTSLLSALPAAN
jgi:hypothetical protein